MIDELMDGWWMVDGQSHLYFDRTKSKSLFLRTRLGSLFIYLTSYLDKSLDRKEHIVQGSIQYSVGGVDIYNPRYLAQVGKVPGFCDGVWYLST